MFVEMQPRDIGQKIVSVRAKGEEKGVYIGNRSDYEVLVKIVCSNETVKNLDCVDFVMKVEGRV